MTKDGCVVVCVCMEVSDRPSAERKRMHQLLFRYVPTSYTMTAGVLVAR